MTTQANFTRREAAIIDPMFAALANLRRTDRAYFEQLGDTAEALTLAYPQFWWPRRSALAISNKKAPAF